VASVKPKLSYKEKQELEKLEKEIRDLNKEKEQLTEKLHDGTINFDMIQQLSQRLMLWRKRYKQRNSVGLN
jgi:hypothetical protein